MLVSSLPILANNVKSMKSWISYRTITQKRLRGIEANKIVVSKGAVTNN